MSKYNTVYNILIIFLFTYVNSIAMRLSYSPCLMWKMEGGSSREWRYAGSEEKFKVGISEFTELKNVFNVETSSLSDHTFSSRISWVASHDGGRLFSCELRTHCQ